MILNPDSDTLYLFAMNSVLSIVIGLSWRKSGVTSDDVVVVGKVLEVVWVNIGVILVIAVEVFGDDVREVVVVVVFVDAVVLLVAMVVQEVPS